MAYNLQSLISILQQILNPGQKHWNLEDHNKLLLESLLEKSVSLKQIHENSSIPKVESLEIQIRDAAHKAEDLIESHMVDQMRDAARKAEDLIESHMVDQMLSHKGTRFNRMQELDSAIIKVLEVREEMKMSNDDLLQVMQAKLALMEKVLLEVKEEMKMSSGSSSSGAAFTGMQTDDEPQQVEQAISALKKLLREMVMEEMKMSSANSSSSGPALTGMQSELEIHQGTRITFVTPDLQEVTQELDSAIKQVVKLMEEHNISSTVTSSSSGAEFLPADPTAKNVVVGIDEDLFQLKDRLTNMQIEQLEIVPIVGMGGIGKTTLARKLYNDPLIVSHFDVRAWTTISQDYNVRAILLGLLRRPNEKLSNELVECQDHELKENFHKRLYCRRYMVVLDDIWSTECWDDIKWCFPDNNNGSRIVLTTRELDVARCVGTLDSQHEMQLLKESESWNLLQQTVFGEEDCPYALEEIGRKIARDCGGLPLAINVIGGVLSKAERSRDVWVHIAKDVRATIAETNDNGFSNVLSLSYNHLPNKLKPCFLYMGAFPEDYEIKASRLMQLLTAEGFLKSNGDKSLEEEAEENLKALVERNLILVREKKSNGKAKCYGMHDLLREVCIRKADEEKFLLHVKNGSEVRLDKLRRVSFDTSCVIKDVDAYASADARSFICAAPNPLLCEEPSLLLSKLRLVRVLDVYETEFQEFPREIYQLVNLRYLAVSCKSGGIPTGISTLCYLQTLIAQVDTYYVPSEIWEMSELRHLKVDVFLNMNEGYMIKFVRTKLLTISDLWLTGPRIRRGFFESIPNIKNLGVWFLDLASSSEVVDLTHLHKLQTLRCASVLNEEYPGDRFPLQKLIFPSSLRKLTLIDCVIFGRFMTSLCALPNLEVLKIDECVFEDNEEWEAAEGDEFRSLQFLQLDELDLVHWRADETNFPRLRELRIGHCLELKEIPSCIGEIPTLQLIEVYKCSPSVVASAKQIEELQQSEFDNYDLQVLIYY